MILEWMHAGRQPFQNQDRASCGPVVRSEAYRGTCQQVTTPLFDHGGSSTLQLQCLAQANFAKYVGGENST